MSGQFNDRIIDMEENIQLRLVGITYNQIESGVYALVLEDVIEKRRLPIVIGYPEAQSIECHLQRVKTPRPLAHDLMANMLKALNAQLIKVDIHRLPTGPYAGKLTIIGEDGRQSEIDARSSDAIALAIRVGAPIYTTRQLLEEKGYFLQGKQKDELKRQETQTKRVEKDWSKFTDAQLESLIEQYVAEENYEAAAAVKNELERRKAKE